MVVKGRAADLSDLNFVIDTGSSRTVLDTQIARKLHLPTQKTLVNVLERRIPIEQARISQLTIGSQAFRKIAVQIADISLRGRDRQVRIDGLVGLDLMRKTNLSIDFGTRMITFGPVSHGQSRFSFYDGLPFILVPLHVGGRRLTLFLDTGSEFVILHQSKTRGRIAMRSTREKRKVHYVGGTAVLKRVVLEQVVIGSSSWEEISALILDGPYSKSAPDGVLAITSLDLRTLNLDFQKNIVSWER